MQAFNVRYTGNPVKLEKIMDTTITYNVLGMQAHILSEITRTKIIPYNRHLRFILWNDFRTGGV